MEQVTEFVARAVMIGVGATIVMDFRAIFLKRAFSIPSLGYQVVGRWLANMPSGKLRHDTILKAGPLPGEAAIGWTAHYVIGVLFAAILLAIVGLDWAKAPTFLPALLMGIATVAVPFLVMQPAFGFGVAASKTSAPGTTGIRSLITHTMFGIGLYMAAMLTKSVI